MYTSLLFQEPTHTRARAHTLIKEPQNSSMPMRFIKYARFTKVLSISWSKPVLSDKLRPKQG